LDDEKSFEYRQGHYIHVNYSFMNNQLTNHLIGKTNFKTSTWIERIVIAGLSSTPKSATITVDGFPQILDIIEENNHIIIRRPGVKTSVLFSLQLHY